MHYSFHGDSRDSLDATSCARCTPISNTIMVDLLKLNSLFDKIKRSVNQYKKNPYRR